MIEEQNSEEKAERVIEMMPEAFNQMIEVLKKAFGSAGLSMIYLMGREKGNFEVHKSLEEIETSSDEHTKYQQLEKVLQYADDCGWGEMAVDQFDMLNGIVTIDIKQNPFEDLCRVPDSGYCFFLRGYLAGILEEITEEEMRVDEVKCVLQGAELCQIRLTKTR